MSQHQLKSSTLQGDTHLRHAQVLCSLVSWSNKCHPIAALSMSNQCLATVQWYGAFRVVLIESQSLQYVRINQSAPLALPEHNKRVCNSQSCHSPCGSCYTRVTAALEIIVSCRWGQRGGMSTPVSWADCVGVSTQHFPHIEAWHSSTFPTHAFPIPILSNEVFDWHFGCSASVLRQGTRQQNHQKKAKRPSCHVLQGAVFLCIAWSLYHPSEVSFDEFTEGGFGAATMLCKVVTDGSLLLSSLHSKVALLARKTRHTADL
jgi:hypothetical protein